MLLVIRLAQVAPPPGALVFSSLGVRRVLLFAMHLLRELPGRFGGALRQVPAEVRVHAVERRLPALTRGEAIFESAFDHHRPVRGEPPTRLRRDHDPPTARSTSRP